MIEPIHLAFDVECPVDHAFDVWTARFGQWWPLDHTVSAEEGLTGAAEMLRDGLFDKYPCDQVYGIHNSWDLPLGTAAILPYASEKGIPTSETT